MKLVAVSNSFEVVLDLRLSRIAATPFRILCKRKRIKMAWNVACAAGIGVVAPRTPNRFRALEDHKGIDALFNGHHSSPKTTEATADDRKFDHATLHDQLFPLIAATRPRLGMRANRDRGQQPKPESKNAMGLSEYSAAPRSSDRRTGTSHREAMNSGSKTWNIPRTTALGQSRFRTRILIGVAPMSNASRRERSR
ncbi:unannotated protein [freshwater metagenome]|uniref:Unannotated protein n=1 Tax=freshwater metagenome TaxID=449393 RepID=A0A6J6D939_9ZZZZ